MNIPFKLKFVIFDEDKEVSAKQKEIRKQLILGDGFKDIIKNAFSNDAGYKFLNRCEASISSVDEQKQLRMSIWTPHLICKKYQHSIHFNQDHSSSKLYFSIDLSLIHI